MNTAKFIFSVLIIISTFTSCQKEINDDTLQNRKWILTEIETDSEDKEPINDIYIEFKDTLFSGYGGCNGYDGSYSLDDNNIDIHRVGSTLKGCIGEGASEYEDLYFRTLKQAVKLKIIRNKLTVICEKGELKFKN